jgi:hypothetical protein
MESNEVYSEIQERECRESDAQERDADTTGEDDGDKFRTLLGYHYEEANAAEYISRERVVVHAPDGYDDTEEEIEDESEVSGIDD